MDVRFTIEADLEMQDAFLWYEQQSTGLGYVFLDAIYQATRRICQFPESGRKFESGAQRVLLARGSHTAFGMPSKKRLL